MAELRWNPLLRTWTLVASSRQNRPHMPADFCPFCPSSGRVPADYVVHAYDNDFPVLKQDPDPVEASDSQGPYRVEEAYGKCEVILYSKDHYATLSELSVDHIRKLVDLWRERDRALSADPKVKLVFPFENKGREVGVTMPHPHGQIYAYGHVPLKLRTELDSARDYYGSHARCIFCDMLAEERRRDVRVIADNGLFTAFLPHFTDYPYGAFIQSNGHLPSLSAFDDAAADGLADMLKQVTGAFDALYDKPFPYMMVMHQAPVNSPEYAGAGEYFHFHIEFYTPLRARDRIKYYASSEMGAWAAANVVDVEDSAVSLRSARLKFLDRHLPERHEPALRAEFIRAFGQAAADIQHFQSPARVNLIGEHIDYNGGLVLPVTIDLKLHIAVRLRDDDTVRAVTLQYPGPAQTTTLGQLASFKGGTGWQDYVFGVAATLAGKRPGSIDRGFDLLYSGSIPDGAGLSSSAALEAVTAAALNDLFGLGLDRPELAALCREAEIAYAGVQCGIMDQYAVLNGTDSAAVLLDCGRLTHELLPFRLGGARLVVMNTNKARRLGSSKYNERLAECRAALERLAAWRRKPDLCSYTPDELPGMESAIADATLFARARHCVTEQARVVQAADALRNGDIERFGKLLAESHQSLRADYQVTGAELDALCDAAAAQDGCYGARMTGAGFGGCALALVRDEAVPAFKRAVERLYAERTGLECSIYPCVPSAGAGSA
ncbi:MAG TPA: galactokinase [Spirochaetales bacterium]|nr:galactokinase [Spirochaetales bacterium]